MSAEFEHYMDRLRQNTRLSDVIGKRIRLARRGRRWVGLCPFHKEKTPSFNINDDKGYYCFGCGAKGDVIAFLMRHDGLHFMDAVRTAAREAGMPPPPGKKPKSPEEARRYDQIKRLGKITEYAAQWYSARLFSDEGKDALNYLKSTRGMDDNTIREFRLGFAPQASTALLAALKKHGCPEDDITAAGLAKKDDQTGELYPFFRNRVIFPINDARKRVIAFGARAMDDNTRAKYLNSAENILFRKRETLYNIDRAAATARKNNAVYVVEGYMDAIALARAGMENVVAPLGTAVSEEQLRALWRLADEPVLCLDGDNSGQRAAARAATRAAPLLKAGKSLSFALLAPGQDPDSLIQGGGAASLRRALQTPRPLADILWQELQNTRKSASPEHQAAFEREIYALTRQIEDPLVRGAYERDFKERLWRARQWQKQGTSKGRSGGGVGGSAGAGSVGGAGATREIARRRASLQTAMAGNRLQREARVLEMALAAPWLLAEGDRAERLALLPERAPDLARLRQSLLEALADDPDIDKSALRAYLDGKGYSGLLKRYGLASAAASPADAETGAHEGDTDDQKNSDNLQSREGHADDNTQNAGEKVRDSEGDLRDREETLREFDRRLRVAAAGERQFVSLWRSRQGQRRQGEHA